MRSLASFTIQNKDSGQASHNRFDQTRLILDEKQREILMMIKPLKEGNCLLSGFRTDTNDTA
jgi:hypothetical protein